VSQVNLLPPELRQRQAVRRVTLIVATIGAGVLAGIVAFYFLQTLRLSSAQDELRAQQQAELAAKQALVDSLYVNEISWSSVLLDVSRVIPDQSYLTNLTGQITAPTGTQIGAVPTEGLVPQLIGNVSFSGVALETETIASWLTRLEEIQGWVNPWVNNSQETGELTRIYTFESSVDLTLEATTERGRGGLQ
jgi:Tfp pilus assembly protein PilN